jgi:hypothetical protein
VGRGRPAVPASPGMRLKGSVNEARIGP